MSSPGSTSPFAPPGPPRAEPWYRRRTVLLGGGVAIIVAIAIVTDLPTSATRASQISTATAFIQEVNSDLAPCDYALNEAYGFRQDLLNHSLTQSQLGQLPGLLRDDEEACSYADESIQDLTSIESPGTDANRELGDMLSSVTQWSTYDALSAIDAIQNLSNQPTSQRYAAQLVHDTALLASDRASAESSVLAAGEVLHTTLREVDLQQVSDPGSA